MKIGNKGKVADEGTSSVSGRHYSRDVGRTSSIGGRIFWQFGDTFCKNLAGEYVGLVAHTVADLLDERYPQMTAYAEFDARDCAKLFIPFTEEEAQLDANSESPMGRPTLWGFGGMVEDSAEAGTGWSWFELGRVVSGCPSRSQRHRRLTSLKVPGWIVECIGYRHRSCASGSQHWPDLGHSSDGTHVRGKIEIFFWPLGKERRTSY